MNHGAFIYPPETSYFHDRMPQLRIFTDNYNYSSGHVSSEFIKSVEYHISQTNAPFQIFNHQNELGERRSYIIPYPRERVNQPGEDAAKDYLAYYPEIVVSKGEKVENLTLPSRMVLVEEDHTKMEYQDNSTADAYHPIVGGAINRDEKLFDDYRVNITPSRANEMIIPSMVDNRKIAYLPAYMLPPFRNVSLKIEPDQFCFDPGRSDYFYRSEALHGMKPFIDPELETATSLIKFKQQPGNVEKFYIPQLHLIGIRTKDSNDSKHIFKSSDYKIAITQNPQTQIICLISYKRIVKLLIYINNVVIKFDPTREYPMKIKDEMLMDMLRLQVDMPEGKTVEPDTIWDEFDDIQFHCPELNVTFKNAQKMGLQVKLKDTYYNFQLEFIFDSPIIVVPNFNGPINRGIEILGNDVQIGALQILYELNKFSPAEQVSNLSFIKRTYFPDSLFGQSSETMLIPLPAQSSTDATEPPAQSSTDETDPPGPNPSPPGPNPSPPSNESWFDKEYNYLETISGSLDQAKASGKVFVINMMKEKAEYHSVVSGDIRITKNVIVVFSFSSFDPDSGELYPAAVEEVRNGIQYGLKINALMFETANPIFGFIFDGVAPNEAWKELSERDVFNNEVVVKNVYKFMYLTNVEDLLVHIVKTICELRPEGKGASDEVMKGFENMTDEVKKPEDLPSDANDADRTAYQFDLDVLHAIVTLRSIVNEIAQKEYPIIANLAPSDWVIDVAYKLQIVDYILFNLLGLLTRQIVE